MMITALLDRLTGLLRAPARPHHSGDTADMVRPFPDRAAATLLLSPITPSLLEALGVRHAHAQRFLPHLRIAARAYDIDASPRRVAAWLATLAHESARFSTLVENLNYSTDGLAQTWPSRYAERDARGNYVRIELDGRARYKPNAVARGIAGRPEQIANMTYAGRLGNGTAGSGDGWRYRGRGLIQITGRDNYARAGAELGLDLIAHPEQLEQPFLAALSAAEWWHRHGCNILADIGDMAEVTRRVNGGLTGLDDRLKLYSAALAYLGGK